MSVPFLSKSRVLLGLAAGMTAVALGSSSAVFAQETLPQTTPAPSPAVVVVTAEPVSLETTEVIPAVVEADTAELAVAAPDPAHVECIAKVIMHEAAYEPRVGRVAVAQVIRQRVRAGYAADPCAAVRARGQFFDIDAFQPARGTTAWAEAVAVATETLNDEHPEAAPGALFFHAAHAPMPRRTRVAQIGGHVFYR
jgi:N-acetylmuramoyl-L-alanine amidase